MSELDPLVIFGRAACSLIEGELSCAAVMLPLDGEHCAKSWLSFIASPMSWACF